MYATNKDLPFTIQSYLEAFYQQIKQESYLALNHPNKRLKNTETQGKVLYESVSKILNFINLTSNDCFLDLGSGCGEIVSQVFLTTSVKEAIGIEILTPLHELALLVQHKIGINFPNYFQKDRKLIFYHADFIKTIVPHATVLFVNATCFSQPLLYEISKLIKNLPFLHTILSTKPIYFLDKDKKFRFKTALSIECSWDSALCYIYNKMI